MAGCTNDAVVVGDDDPDAGSTGEGSSAVKTTGEPSKMNAEVLQELHDLGFDEFFGKAVIKEEITEGNVSTITFDPASGPICLRGDDFHIFVRDKGSENLVFQLSGGGACWTGMNMCWPQGPPVLPPASMFGILDENNPENVAKDWNVIFITYCDGSIFYGSNEVEEPDGSIRYHHGMQNLSAGVDIAMERFPDMKKVLVFGGSAGGYGTFTGMPVMRMAYPQAELFVINDSGPGLQNPDEMDAIETRLKEWDMAHLVPPECESCEGGRAHVTGIINWALENDSGLTTGMASYDQDFIIGTVFLGYPGPVFKKAMIEETDKIHAKYPDRFKRFLVPGASHVVMGAFFTAEIDGVTYAEWTRGMIEGDDTKWRDLIGDPL